MAAVRTLAEKYDIEMIVMEPGFSSPMSDYHSDGFHRVERAIHAVYPHAVASPYLMTGASDCRYMSRVCDTCIRFAPLYITQAQMDSIHGIDENVDLSALAPAVDFYKHLIAKE